MTAVIFKMTPHWVGKKTAVRKCSLRIVTFFFSYYLHNTTLHQLLLSEVSWLVRGIFNISIVTLYYALRFTTGNLCLMLICFLLVTMFELVQNKIFEIQPGSKKWNV
jgi:hypothetical protein